jgi:hypothetical protein
MAITVAATKTHTLGTANDLISSGAILDGQAVNQDSQLTISGVETYDTVGILATSTAYKIGTDGKLLYSSDGGTSWTQIGSWDGGDGRDVTITFSNSYGVTVTEAIVDGLLQELTFTTNTTTGTIVDDRSLVFDLDGTSDTTVLSIGQSAGADKIIYSAAALTTGTATAYTPTADDILLVLSSSTVAGNAIDMSAANFEFVNIDASEYNADITFTLSDSAVDLKGGTANDTINATIAQLDTAIDGGTGVDELVMGDAGTIDFSGISIIANVEKLQLADGTNTITLDDYFEEVTGGTGADTIDASGRGAVLSAGEGEYDLKITTGAGTDNVTLSTGKDSVNLGDDDDTLTITDVAQLTGDDIVAAGEGGTETNGDTVSLDNAITGLTNDKFEGLSEFENITGGTGLTSLELGDNARLAGLTTVDISASTSAVTVDTSGMTTNAAMDITGSDAGTVVKTRADHLTSADTIAGGATTTADADILEITTAGSVADTDGDFDNVSGFETLKITAQSGNVTVEINDNDFTKIDSSTSTGDNTIDTTAETGDLIINTGSGSDKIDTGDGNVTIDAGAGDNTITLTNTGTNTSDITTGSGDDSVVLNSGVDTLDLGAGTNNISVDYANWTTTDTIAGSGENILTINDALTDDGSATTVESKLNASDNIDTIVLSDNSSQQVTLGDVAKTAGVTKIDASAITTNTNTLTVDLTTEAMDLAGADFTVIGGAGTDTVKMVSTDLTSAVSLQMGGAAATEYDTLEITDTATIVDADFTLSSGLEKIVLADLTDESHSLTLGDEAKEAGIVVIDASAVTTVDADAGEGEVTIDLSSAATDTEFDEITLGVNDDSIVMKGTHLTANDTIDGGDGLDTLTFSSKIALADGVFADVSNIEKLVLSAGENQSIAIGTNAKATGIGEIDGSAAGTTTVDLTAASDMALNVTLGAGNDTVTMGDSAYNIVLGNGDNTVKTASAYLTSGDKITGGSGTDILEITDAATVIDDDFDQVTAFETLKLANAANDLTLGAKAIAAGVDTIDASAALTGNDLTVTVEATGFDIEGGAGDDVLKTDSTTLASTTFDGAAADTVNKIVLTDEAAITDTSFANITNVQTLELDDFDADQSVVLGSASSIATNAVNSRLNTIDGSNLTGARSVTVDISGMTEGMTVDTAGGDDTITLGRGADDIDTGAGDDIIKVSSANLTSADTIAGGTHLGTGGVAGDILEITDGTNAITDAMFTNITGVETLYLSKSGDTYNVTLEALAIAAGITEVRVADGVIANIDLSDALTAIKVIKDGAADVTVTTEDTNAANDYVFGTGNDTVKIATGNFDSSDSYDFGTGTTDTIEITNAATVVDADFTNVSNLDVLKVSNAVNDITLGDNAQNSGISSVDLTAVTTATNTQDIDISSMTNNMELDINGSAGVDTITMKAEHLTNVDDLDGGANDDVLEFTTLAGSVTTPKGDADFAGVTNIETLKLAAGSSAQTQSLSLGSNALGSFETIDGSAVLGTLKVDLTAADDIEVKTSTGTLEVTMDAAELSSADTLTGGSGSDDKLILDTVATDVDETDLSGVTGIETLELQATTGAQSVTLAGDFTTVDASVTDTAITIDAATTAGINLSNVTTGDGGDTLKINEGDLASTDSLDFGAGTDTLEVMDDATSNITDADFENIDNLETVKLNDFDGQDISLGNLSALAGVRNVDVSAVAATRTTTVDLSGMTTEGINHKIIGGAGNEIIEIQADHLEATDSIVGAGGNDEIIITTAAELADADFTEVTGVEKITLQDTSANQILSLGEQALEEGIDTVDASATGSVSITIADTTSQHDLDITTGAGADTITMKAEDLSSADSITAGNGADELILTANGANTTITASAFENVGGVEKLTLEEAGAYTQSVSLDGDIVIVDASAATAAVTIDADENSIDLGEVTTGTGADTLKIKSADFLGDSDNYDFAGGTDTLELTTDANGLADSDFVNVDGLEVVKLSDITAGSTDQSIAIGDNALGQGLTTVDLTGITTNTNTTTIDMSSVTLLKDVTVNGGAGADTIKMKTEHLTSGDNLDGNGGADILELTTVASNLTNAEFANVSDIETLKLADVAASQKLTLGDNAVAASKITNIDATGVDGTVEIDLDSVTTNVDLGITGGDANDTLSMKAEHLNADDTIDLAGGAGDTLSLSATSDATITTDTLSGVNNVEKLELTSSGVTYDVELTTGITEIDATGTDDSITIDAATNGIDLAKLTTDSGDDLLQIKQAQFTSADSLAFGTGDDTLQVMDAATITNAHFTNVTGLENVKLGNFDSQSVTLGDLAVTAGVDTINASGITNSTYDLTVSLETITNDATTNVTSGAGDDSITMKGDHLTSADALNGGSGTDTLTFSSAASLTDADFANVTNIENLVLKDASGNSLALGDNALASFTNSISVETTTSADNDVAIDMSSATGDTDVNITTIGGDDTITINSDHLTSSDTINTGSGSDTLAIADAANLTATDFTNVSGIATLELQATTGAQSVVMANGFTTLDASVSGDAVTVDATLHAVDLDVTLGSNDDTIKVDNGNLDGSNTHDTIDGGAGTDTLHIINADDTTDLTDARLVNVTNVEKIKITDSSDAVDITLGAAASAKGINTIDLSSTASVNTVDLTGMTTDITVDGGSGQDIVTLDGSGSDFAVTVDTGSGDDTVYINAAELTNADNIAGGLGNDTLILTGSISASTSLANVTGFESIQFADGNQEIVLGADGDTNNIDTLNVNGVGNANTVTVDISDYVEGGAGAADLVDVDDFTYVGAKGTDTFKMKASHLSSSDVLDGGTRDDGGVEGDTLEFTDAISSTSSLIFNNVSNFEILKLADVASDQSLVIKQGTFSKVTVDALHASTNAITINAGNVTSNITLETAGGDDVIIASKGNNDIDTGAGDDTIKFNVGNFNGDDTIEGGDGTDTLEFIDVKTVITDGMFDDTQNVENIQLSQNEAGQSVTLGANADSAGIASVATIGGANDVTYGVTIDAGTGFGNDLAVTTGAGADTITLGSGANTVLSGAGADTIKIAASNFNSSDNIDGEGDNDTLELVGAASSLADSAFTNVSNVESLKLDDQTSQSLTLGTLANAAGIKTIDTSALADNKTVSIDLSGFDVDTTITGGEGDETITLTSTTLDGNDSIDLDSSGTDADKVIFADALAGGSANPNLSGLSGVETIQLAAGASQEITLVDTINSDLTIDATNLVDTDGVTVDGSALGSSTTKFTVNTNTGVDTIKLGSSTNVVDAGGRDDTIEISAANLGDANTDTINGGDGTDTLDLTLEGTVADASLEYVTNIENVVLSDVDGDYDITLGTQANANSIVNIDGSALTTGTVSVDASTLGAKDVEFKGGNADDTFSVAGAQLTSADTLDGKNNDSSDSDTLVIKDGSSTDTTIADSAFTNVTNMEVLEYAEDANHTVNVGAEFYESNITSIDASTLTSANALTVNVESGPGTTDFGLEVIGGAGDDTVKMDATSLTSADTLTLGSGDNTLQLSGTATGADAITDADFGTSTDVDTIEFTENYAQEITVGTTAMSAGVSKIDATSLTSQNATVTASAFTNDLEIVTGGGTDTIALGSGDANVKAGASDDTVSLDGTTLDANDTINGEGGTDILDITTEDDLVDSNFTNITNMETLQLSVDANQTLTLGDEFKESGITKIDASALTSGSNDLNVDFSSMSSDGDMTVIGGAGDDIVEMNGNHTGITSDYLTSSDKIELGAGTADTILITSTADETTQISDSDFSLVTGVEVLKFSTYENSVEFGDAMKTAGVETIDGSSNTNIAYGLSVDMTAMSTANTSAIGGYTLLGGAGDDHFIMRADQISASDTITGNTNGSLTGDTLEFTTAVIFSDASKFANVTGIDVIKLADTSGQSLVLRDDLTSVVDASGLDALNGVTVDGSALTKNIEINTGAGDDIIKVGSASGETTDNGDKGSFLAGNDTLTMAAANFDENDSFDFGTGTDELILTGATTLTDTDFTNISGLETITLDNAVNSLTLGDRAKAAGLTKIDNSAATTNDATIDMSSMSSNIGLDLLGAAGVETITMQGTQFDSDDTIDGGAGTDIIELTESSYVTDAAFTNVTNVETLKLADGTHKLTLGSLAEAAGIVTIDTSVVTENLNIDISGTSGNIALTGQGGADTLVMGQGDNVVSSGAGDDIIKVSSANLTAADDIDGEGGNDTLVLTTAINESTDSIFAQVDNIETLQLANFADQEVTLHADNDFTKVDGSKLGGTNAVTIDVSATAGDLEIISKGGDDVIVTGDTSAKSYTIDSGRGDDLLQFSDASAITSANDDIDGGDGTDTLEFTSTTASVMTDSFFGNHIDNIETLKFGGDADGNSLTFGLNAQNLTGLRTIDTTGVTTSTNTTTVNLADAGVAMEVIGGAGIDVVTVGGNNDTIDLGAGDDTLNVTVTSDRLNSDDTIDGGDGTDTITFANALNIADSVFENITNIETMNLYGTANKTLTLGDNAETSGVSTVNADTTDGSTAYTGNVVINGSDFANDIDIVTGNGTDTVTIGSGAVSITTKDGNDTINVEGKLFDTNDTIDGGLGDDVVKFTDAVDLTDTMLGKISNVEVIKFSDKSNQTAVIGTAAMTNDIFEYDARAITAANSITMDFSNVGTNEALTVYGGLGNDEFIFNIGDFDTSDVLIAGAGTDTLTFADQVTSGAAFDDLFADANKKNSIDIIKLSNTGTQTLTLANDAITAGIDAIDATDLTEISNLNIDATNFTVALEITSNGGADTIIAGTGADKFVLGVGDDSVTYRSNFLTAADTLQGGIGNDTLYFSNEDVNYDGNLFANVSGFEKLVFTNTSGVTNLVNFGSDIEDSGLVHIDATVRTENFSIDMSDMNIDFTLDTGSGDDEIEVGGANADIHAGDGDDTITIQASQLDSNDILQGGNDNDTLELTTASTGGGVALVDADFAGVTSIETLKLANFSGQEITLGDIADSTFKTIDASLLGGGNGVTIDATGVDTPVFTIIGGGGDDIIKLGTAADIVDGNGGDDTFIIRNADFTIDDTIVGDGGAEDTIEISDTATVIDADFTNVTTVEILKLNDFASQSVYFGDVMEVRNLTKIDASAVTSSVDFVISPTVGNVIDINGTNFTVGTADVDILGGTAADTFNVTDENITVTLGINGGTGDDNLVITDTTNLIDVELTNFESVEKITLSDYADQSLTLGVQATEMGLNEIDASALTGTNSVTVNMALLDRDIIMTGGAGDDVVKITMANTDANDTIDLGAGNDTLFIDDAVNAGSTGSNFEDWLASGNGQNLSNIETLELDNIGGQELVLGTAANALGLTHIDLTNVTSSVTIDATNFDSSIVLNGVTGGHKITTATTAHNDTITVDGGNDTIVLGAGDDTIDVGIGNDIVEISSTNLDANDTIYGDVGTDTLIITGIDSQALTDAQFTNIDKFETIILEDANGQDITLGVNAKDTGITKLDGSATTAANGLTIDISGFTENISIIGGEGADVFTGGQGNDNVNLGDNDDTINYSSDYLNSQDFINGGDGTDTLIITDKANLVDAQFTNVNNVEILKISQDVAGQTIQLGAQAVGAGIRTLDLTDITGENFSVDTSAFNQSLEILVNRPGGTFETSNLNDTIQIEQVHLDENMSYSGGNGTDTIRISDSADLVDTDFTNFVSVEVVDLRDGGDLVIADTAVLAGITTVDLSNSASASDIDASGFNRVLNVHLGSQNDTITTHDTNTINDIVYTNNAQLSENDVINLGAGTNDAIVIKDTASINFNSATGGFTNNGSNITNVEVLKLGNDGNHTVDFTNNASSISKLDGTSMTNQQTSTITVEGVTEDVEVRMGGADDTIRMTFADFQKFSDDTTRVDTNDLDGDGDTTESLEGSLFQKVIDGGGGFDTLMITDAGDITDALFDDPTRSLLGMLNFVGFEAIGSEVGGNITIGDNAAAENITTVDVRQASGNSNIETGAIEQNVTIYLGDDDDSVSTGAGNDTLYIDAEDLDSNDYIEMGNGSLDTIVLTSAANYTDSTPFVSGGNASVVNVEILELASDDADQTVVLTDTHFDTFDARDVNNGGSVTVDVTGTTAGDITAQTNIYLGAGDDTLKMKIADMAAVDKIINGGAGVDTIELTDTTSATLVDADFTNNSITAFETIKMEGSLTAATNFFGTGISNIIASDALTFDGSGLNRVTKVTGSSGDDDITTGNFNDTITDVSGNDTVDTGAGADRFIFDGADLDGSDNIDGGDGVDTIQFTTGVGTFANADYGVSNVENIIFADAAGQDFEYGAAALGAGLEYLDARGLDAANGITITKSATTTTTDTLVFDGGDGDDKIILTDENLEATDNYEGNDGNDTIEITATGNAVTTIVDSQLTLISEFETLKLNSATNTLTLAAEFIGSGITTIDAGGTTGVSNIDMSAVAAVKAYDITGGDVVDTITMQTNVFNSGITIDGGTDTDVLIISNRANITDSAFSSITNLEVIELSSTGGIFDLGNDARTAAIETIDGSASAANSTVLIDMTSMTDGDLNIEILGGAANDVFEMKVDHLTTNDTIDGDAGTDVLRLSDTGTALADADFTNLSNLETLYFENGASYTAVMGTNAQASGITFIDADQVNDGSSINIDASDAAYDSTDMTIYGTNNGDDVIKTAGGNDNIDGNSGDDIITSGAGNDIVNGDIGDDKFIFTSANIDENDDVIGGAGTDTIEITDAASFGATDFSGTTGVEKLALLAGGTVEVNTTMQNAGIREIDASASASDAITVDASDATVALTIKGGGQDDVIYAGHNTDNITGGAGDDKFVFTSDIRQNGANTITDFGTGTNKIALSFANGTTDAIGNTRGTDVNTDDNLSVSDFNNFVQEITFNTDDNYTLITLHGGDTISLLGVSSGIDANDFVYQIV